MPDKLKDLLRLWFGLHARVGRGDYLASGLFLAGIKYLGDVALVWVVEKRLWTLADYLGPLGWSARNHLEAHWVHWAMLLWMIPFVWIGISMTVRRARDSAVPVWIAFLFFVPGLNYLVILLLSALPTRRFAEPLRAEPEAELEVERARARSVVTGVVLGVMALIPILALALAAGRYSVHLFVGAPFLQGVVAAFAYVRRSGGTLSRALSVATLSVLAAGGLLFLGGLEGVLCLAMALPIALVPAAAGAVIGHALARSNPLTSPSLLVVVVLSPLVTAVVPSVDRPLREVETVIEIDAPPQVVWNHVTRFTELPPVTELFFRLGIAHPVSAHYVGHGEDAVRYCEFSTGAFVEPITRWDEPHRLSFDLTAQPPTMEEWSPYRNLQPPHVESSLHSRRGEFRLIPLPGGRTRLEGSTWYELEMEPQIYWTLWSDGLIHAIHRRVLNHIKRQAEAAVAEEAA